LLSQLLDLFGLLGDDRGKARDDPQDFLRNLIDRDDVRFGIVIPIEIEVRMLLQELAGRGFALRRGC
jgi:hypothetical protein